jgi:hypothetical protein
LISDLNEKILLYFGLIKLRKLVIHNITVYIADIGCSSHVELQFFLSYLLSIQSRSQSADIKCVSKCKLKALTWIRWENHNDDVEDRVGDESSYFSPLQTILVASWWASGPVSAFLISQSQPFI